MTLQKWTAGELAGKVLRGEELFILDVRNESDFDSWKIEGRGVEILNIPYFDLMEGVDDLLDKIPANKQVLVVCAKEGSSIFVAEQIVEATQREVFYLEGGMKAWSEHLEPVKIGDLKGGGEIYQFVRIGKGCLSYLVAADGEAALIDTMRMTAPFLTFAAENGLTIKHVLDTHLHADHISGGRTIAEQTGAAYWLPPKDAEEVTFSYSPLVEGADITVGQSKVQIQPVYSPGHTIGSTSFIVDQQYLLTGDILFVESIGRPDLAGKAEDWVSDLRTTLYQRYKELPDELVVLPAHFGGISELNDGGQVMTVLRRSYAENKGLQVEDEQQFRRMVTENLPPQPNAYQEIRQTNMGRMSPSPEEQQEMEIGPNRCAIHG